MNLLSGGVAMPRIVVLVKERGIDFPVNPRLEQTVLDSGGDEGLVAALREQAQFPGGGAVKERHLGEGASRETRPPEGSPAPAARPRQEAGGSTGGDPAVAQLRIRSRPGEAAIYLDGVLKGTTDAQEGVLEVGVSKSGKHVLRASREGYQDVEATVDLARGQVLETPIWLSKAESTPAKAAAAPELPSGKKFLVRHVHRAIAGVAEAGYCQGWMIVNVGFIRFISTDSPHKYLMNTSEMKQAKAASGAGNFSIKLDFGREHQFVAVDEQGGAVNVGPVLAEIRYSMGE